MCHGQAGKVFSLVTANSFTSLPKSSIRILASASTREPELLHAIYIIRPKLPAAFVVEIEPTTRESGACMKGGFARRGGQRMVS